MLTTFANDATVAVLADWAELDHLLSSRRRSTDSRVIRADRTTTDEDEHGPSKDVAAKEIIEIEILEPAVDERRQRLWDELSRRQNALGEAYPFAVEPTATGWAITTRSGGHQNCRIARLGYIVALLTASFRHHHIQQQIAEPDEWVALEKEVASRFQALSVLAAGNIFGPRTQVYWFGFPRPNHSGFHVALRSLVEKIGYSTIRDTPPYGTENDQDATIDLVAWRTFGDRTYGSLLLFGQVASGNNWNAKSVFSQLNNRFFEHFTDEPARFYLGATFIPFVLYNDAKVPKDGNFAGAMDDMARSLERNHGLVADRIRVTELLAAGIIRPEQLHNNAPILESARSAMNWINRTRVYCSQSA